MTASIFWYDYETTGISPRKDRPLQVAGIRTTETLEEIGEPLNLYCRPADDVLPHPIACLVTGITPSVLSATGLCEAEFMTRLHREMSVPQTCVAGYNNLRFDDEMTRYSLYRNFFDPYAREWQGGNSRWDLIDLMRTAYALRPEGMHWPEEEGRVTLKLERLTEANGLAHAQAHDALSDVRATIALARRIRECQPRLYDYVYQLRRKHAVLETVRLLEPVVHVSGRFSAERRFLSVVLPLAWHPRNRNALIVFDLGGHPEGLLDESAEALKARLYTRREQLPDGVAPVPLKLLHVNRCPIVAPLSVIRPQDRERLGLELQLMKDRAGRLRGTRSVWQNKLHHIYTEESSVLEADPDQQLYEGFIGDRDRRLCDEVRGCSSAELAIRRWTFSDSRLTDLLFRYRARNYPESLDTNERSVWSELCSRRLSGTEPGAAVTVGEFMAQAGTLMDAADNRQRAVLEEWVGHVMTLCERYRIRH